MSLLLLLPLLAVARAACDAGVVSCTPKAVGADPCCVPKAGLFHFRQRFDPEQGDAGTWGIDALDVFKCDGTPATEASRKLTHEEIGRLAASALNDEAERSWAASEVGESVEEVWERSWNTAGRFVFPSCPEASTVPMFFGAVAGLHKSKPTGQLLDDAGIIPSADVEYSLGDVSAALGEGIPLCEGEKLVAVVWPLHARGGLEGWVAAESGMKSNCPREGIVYPPGEVITTPTNTFDPIYRPTMRPITMSADESRRYKYEPPEEKLGFFHRKDKRRGQGHEEL